MSTAADTPLDQVPGAMAVTLTRTLPGGGVIKFESAPAGWLTKDGNTRRKDWRRYRYTGAPEAHAVQYPSVTTICGAVLPKPALPIWAEAQGIIGAREAIRRGLSESQMPDEDFIRVVRRNQLGADAARDTAADRGLSVHAILEAYARDGRTPNPADHPETHRPFIQGLVKWLLWADPEPVAVELLVCDPERGYAGRADLIARIGHKLTLVDLKTSPAGAIYDSAHLQIELLRQAEERYGEHGPFDQQLLVSVNGRGGFREMECVAGPELAARALLFYSEARDLCTKCETANRIERGAIDEGAIGRRPA